MGISGDWEIRQEPGGTISFDMGGSPYVGNEPFPRSIRSTPMAGGIT
jgi:hypothetical protein